jgi:hypothetical protein
MQHFAEPIRRAIFVPSRFLSIVLSVIAMCFCSSQGAVAQTTQVTITSEPPGNEFTVDGTGCGQRPGATYKSPVTFGWTRMAKCTIYWVSPAGSTMLYRWNDGSNLNPRLFDSVTENSIFTATFTQAAFLTADVQCRDARQQIIACPSPPGTIFFRGLLPGAVAIVVAQTNAISLAGLFPTGSNVSVNATVNNGFAFEGWLTPTKPSGISASPQVVVPVSERNVTAVFRKN